MKNHASSMMLNSYERADFGITIKLTPIIHEPDVNDAEGTFYVTLENDISFENLKMRGKRSVQRSIRGM